MAQAWSAERTISESLAGEMIEEQFPGLSPIHLRELAVGWDNTAFEVNDRYVFRFPRRQVAVDLLARERRVLPVIAPMLPLRIPVPTFMGEPDERFGWPFSGYEMLPGRTADVVSLTEEQRRRASEPLGRFLAALHAIDIEVVAPLGLPGDVLGRLDVKKRAPRTRENLNEISRLGLIDDCGPWFTLVDEIESSPRCTAKVIVHGDLYSKHVLFDSDGRLCGVIDWGDVHLGEPALDLSIAHGLLPPSAHESFRSAYGSIDDDRWRWARFRALYHASVTIPYGHAVGDNALVREGLKVLNHMKPV